MLEPLISDKVKQGAVDLIEVEMKAAQIYRFMYLWCLDKGYTGAAKWYKKQSEEEQGHAFKVAEYLISRNAMCSMLPPVEVVQLTFENILQVLTTTYSEEVSVEVAWQEFGCMVKEEEDKTTFVTLVEPFLVEQVHEIDKVADLINKVTMYLDGGDKGYAWGKIDEVMGCNV